MGTVGRTEGFYSKHGHCAVVGFEDSFISMLGGPARALFQAIDGRGGRLLYIFPPYEANDHLNSSTKVLFFSFGSLVLGLLALMFWPATKGCVTVLLVLFLGGISLVLLSHRGRPSIKVYDDGIRFNGKWLSPRNFYSVDVYPQVSDLYHGNPKGGHDFDLKPFFEFLFTLDLGGRDHEVSIDVICKASEVEVHLFQMRQYLPGMRTYFHRGMEPDTGPLAQTVLRAIKDPKDLLKSKLKLP